MCLVIDKLTKFCSSQFCVLDTVHCKVTELSMQSYLLWHNPWCPLQQLWQHNQIPRYPCSSVILTAWWDPLTLLHWQLTHSRGVRKHLWKNQMKAPSCGNSSTLPFGQFGSKEHNIAAEYLINHRIFGDNMRLIALKIVKSKKRLLCSWWKCLADNFFGHWPVCTVAESRGTFARFGKLWSGYLFVCLKENVCGLTSLNEQHGKQ